jgi:hypothetical protein
MKVIKSILFAHRPGTRSNPQGAWYSPRHHCTRANGYWSVFQTDTKELLGTDVYIAQAHTRMVELERIADAKEAK